MVFQLFNAEKPAETQTKSSSTAPLFALHGSGRPAWSPRDTSSLTRNGYAGNPVGYRCVRLISESAASVATLLQGEGAQYETHPMLSLLGRPNEHQGISALLESFYGHLLLSGDGYLEAAGDRASGGPAFLYVLRSDRMRVVQGGDGWPVAYEYRVGGKRHRFDMRCDAPPVLHVRAFHPQDDHYGLSPMHAAASAVDVHNAASRWSKALLDNAARPSGAIVYKGSDGAGTLGGEQYERLVDELEQNHQGARNAGRPMLLEGGLDWKPMGFSPSDMEFHRTKETAAREIAVAFGVPPMMLGIPGDNTYANYQEANRAFYRLTVLPLVTKVMAAVSGWLSLHFGQELLLAPDLDQVSALSAEREALRRRVSRADFLTPEEKRRILGLPKLAENE